MENQGNNGICPKCGMFLNDGVCPECGYSATDEGTVFENDQTSEMPAGTEAETPVSAPAGDGIETAENGAGQMGGYQQDSVDLNKNYQQSGENQGGFYQQGEANVNGGYQQGGANVNGGYQQNGAGQNGYYQQGEANVNGGYQQNGANQNGYYQQGGANANGGYQQNVAGQNGYYQQGGANVNGGYQQNGAGQNGYYQQGGANASGGYYQQNVAGQNGYYQQGGANANGYYQQNGGSQNGYYQNPQGQNGYNGYNPNQPPQKGGSKGAVIAAVIGGLLLLVLVIALILVVSAGLKNDKGSLADDRNPVERGTDKDDNKDNDDNDDYDPFSDDKDDNDRFSDLDDDSYWDDDYDPMEFVNDIDWDDESWKEEPVNNDPEDVGDEFYYELCNCIDRSVDYQINFETFEDSDESQNICMRISYYQLDGDIPNLEDINEGLKETALYYNTYYNDNIDDYEKVFAEYGSGYVVAVDSFVTYNDDEKLSIVMNQYYESPVEINKHVISLNIDLEAGIILYNTDFFDISDEFLEYYRDICKDQNGSVPALRYFDNDELRDFFEDEDDLILYYTPCGFEVGINYETDESYGWVTATLVDCEQYLRSY